MGLHDEAKLDRKFMELAKLMNIYLNHFPKHEKYGLALEIRRTAYAMYGYIVEAQKRYHKNIRKHSLYKFGRALRRGDGQAAVSILGHARRTHSRRHLLRIAQQRNADLIPARFYWSAS